MHSHLLTWLFPTPVVGSHTGHRGIGAAGSQGKAAVFLICRPRGPPSSPRRGATLFGRELMLALVYSIAGPRNDSVSATHPIAGQILTSPHLGGRLALVGPGRGNRGCAGTRRRAPSTGGPMAAAAVRGLRSGLAPCRGSLGEAALWVGAQHRGRLQAIVVRVLVGEPRFFGLRVSPHWLTGAVAEHPRQRLLLCPPLLATYASRLIAHHSPTRL